MTEIDKVSDNELQEAYCQRFSVKVGEVIKDSPTAARHAVAFLGDRICDREHFICILLNGRNAHIHTSLLFSGTITSAAVYPREIIKLVLQYNSCAAILVHNHPSSNLTPSQEDKDINRKILTAMSSIDCKVLDFIIVVPGGKDYTSFADLGLL